MRLAPRNPAGEASEGRDQSAGYARRSQSHAVADVGSIPTVSIDNCRRWADVDRRWLAGPHATRVLGPLARQRQPRVDRSAVSVEPSTAQRAGDRYC